MPFQLCRHRSGRAQQHDQPGLAQASGIVSRCSAFLGIEKAAGVVRRYATPGGGSPELDERGIGANKQNGDKQLVAQD